MTYEMPKIKVTGKIGSLTIDGEMVANVTDGGHVAIISERPPYAEVTVRGRAVKISSVHLWRVAGKWTTVQPGSVVAPRWAVMAYGDSRDATDAEKSAVESAAIAWCAENVTEEILRAGALYAASETVEQLRRAEAEKHREWTAAQQQLIGAVTMLNILDAAEEG
jgi:hypothetical protein